MGVLKNPTYKPRYIPKVQKREEDLQRRVCTYIRYNWPNVIFRSDYASGLHLTFNQARIHRSLQSGKSFPDIFIFEPRIINGKQYYGMALELKKEGTAIIVTKGPRKGKLVSNPHIQEQYLMLRELSRRGYYANFAVGYNDAIKRLDWYFNVPVNEALPF